MKDSPLIIVQNFINVGEAKGSDFITNTRKWNLSNLKNVLP